MNSSSLINGSDFIAVVLSSDEIDPKEQIKKGISAIDLGNCTEQIKEYYNISKDESLIILNMESKRDESNTNEKIIIMLLISEKVHKLKYMIIQEENWNYQYVKKI